MRDYYERQAAIFGGAFIVATVVALALFAAFIDTRAESLSRKRAVADLTANATSRERLVQAQAKMLRERPVRERVRIVYRELP